MLQDRHGEILHPPAQGAEEESCAHMNWRWDGYRLGARGYDRRRLYLPGDALKEFLVSIRFFGRHYWVWVTYLEGAPRIGAELQ